jgi:hypothetical protein
MLAGLVLVVIGCSFVYYRTQQSKTVKTAVTQVTPTPGLSEFETTLTNEFIVPAGWTINTDTGCKVSYPLPPFQEPYSSSTGTGVKVLWTSKRESYFTGQTTLYYPNGNSDGTLIDIFLGRGSDGKEILADTLARISLWCSVNTSEASLSTFTDAWVNQFVAVKGNSIISQATAKRWGGESTKLVVNENGIETEYHLVSTPKQLYVMNPKIRDGKILSVKTHAIIFNNLKFGVE